MRTTLLDTRKAIVLVLDMPGDRFEIIERVRDRTEGRVRLNVRTVSPALRAMERERLLRSWVVPPAGGSPRRRCYELTVKGVAMHRTQREALQALLGKAPDPPTPEVTARMVDGLRRCAELSAFVLELRQRMNEQARPKR